MHRFDIINHYLGCFSHPRFYLEIGVRRGGNFNLIDADHKDGVDPDRNSKCNYVMTSDEFFMQNSIKYDVIFIDGLHLYEQAYKDVKSSLGILKENGIIIMHDCNPSSEWLQREYDTQVPGGWCGTVWKAFVRLRMEREDIEMFVVDTDHGVGVLNPNGRQKIYQCIEDIYNYNVFDKNRVEALNLISVEEFKKKSK